jgi:hypothetical protein
MHVEHEGSFESHLDLRRRQPAHVLFLCFDLGLESGVETSAGMVASEPALAIRNRPGQVCSRHASAKQRKKAR